MKNLFNNLLDGLTYKDLAGKRQPRTFAVLGGIVLFLVFLVFCASASDRNAMLREAQATPRPLQITALPTQTVVVTEQPTESVGCPTNPDDWSLADVPISQNYKRIQPACVYDGLAHTVAWALAVRQGYSRAEATTALGFDEMPMKPLDQVSILTDLKGPLTIPVRFISPRPDFTEWRVDAKGQPAISYGLRGCFRTASVVGNQVENWGGDYAVICVVVEDAEGVNAVLALKGHLYTAPIIPTRSFLLFGYTGKGTWFWLGAEADLDLAITDPNLNAKERSTVAAFYDSQPWDAKWLDERYHLSMRPLPENWRSATSEAAKQAILDGLNQEAQP